MKTNLCVSMTGRSFSECLKFVSECHANLIEHRLDFMSKNEPLDEIYDATEIPILVTCRSVLNGGCFKGSEDERVALLLDGISAGAAYVDIEIETPRSLFHMVQESAETSWCKLIVSKHYHRFTPEFPELTKMYHQTSSKKADIVKIVTTPNSVDDCRRTMQLYTLRRRGGQELIAFSMGELGRITRLCALFLGAPFMYVAMDDGQEAAPGQLTLTQMKLILEALS